MGLREAIISLRALDTSARACGTGACVRVPGAWRGELLAVKTSGKQVRRGLAVPCGNSAHITVPKQVAGQKVHVERPDVWSRVQEFASTIRAKIPGTQIWLFGSHLNGEPNQWSDVDLLVVTPKRVSRRTLSRFWKGKQRPEILTYSREEFREELGLCGIVDEAVRTGAKV